MSPEDRAIYLGHNVPTPVKDIVQSSGVLEPPKLTVPEKQEPIPVKPVEQESVPAKRDIYIPQKRGIFGLWQEET